MLDQRSPERLPKTDICIVAGARPELLERTLGSFHARLVGKLNVSSVIANIDLFGGGEAERERCGDLLLSLFPQVKIFRPAQPGFSAAVKRVWEATCEKLVLHMEDDWILLEDVDPQSVLAAFDDTTRAVKFLSRDHNHHPMRDGDFDIGWIRHRFLGLTYRKEPFNRHGTSPGFFDGCFIRKWAALLDPSLDPEKQSRPPWNPALFDHVRRYRSRFIYSSNRGHLVEDIGRQWRDDHGLIKLVVQGRSEWRNA